jgi:hypothetical protein
MNKMINVSDSEVRDKLQKFYAATRSLLSSGAIPAMYVQRSFEEAIAGYLGEDTWRPSHISPAAIVESATVTHRNIQRAHGVVGDRMDRYTRTINVLTGPEKSFEDWWQFWIYHDQTVMITRDEHIADKKFQFNELIEIPRDLGLFTRGGFSFSFRKKKEQAWVEKTYKEIKNSGTVLT